MEYDKRDIEESKGVKLNLLKYIGIKRRLPSLYRMQKINILYGTTQTIDAQPFHPKERLPRHIQENRTICYKDCHRKYMILGKEF